MPTWGTTRDENASTGRGLRSPELVRGISEVVHARLTAKHSIAKLTFGLKDAIVCPIQ
jgi:hypothetical protein